MSNTLAAAPRSRTRPPGGSRGRTAGLAVVLIAATLGLSPTSPAEAHTNTGVDVRNQAAMADADVLAYFVNEPTHGEDLNDDEDATDTILFTHDLGSGTTHNTGIPVISWWLTRVGDGQVAFVIHEVAEGADLNGDGDTDDAIVHVYDTRDGSLINLATRNGGQSPEVVGDTFIFRRLESDSGGDLNGDGDELDAIVHTYDPEARSLRSIGANGAGFTPLDETTWAFFAFEHSHGDLNGDGDARDFVLHTYDTTHGTLINRGVTAPDYWALAPLDDGNVAARTTEQILGSDVNGDGSIDDEILAVHDVANGSTSYAPYAMGSAMEALPGGRVLFNVSEFHEGRDVNGDGDALDAPLHVFDPSTGDATDLGRTAYIFGAHFGAGGLLLAIPESDQGEDLTGDGDTSDSVLGVFDRATLEVESSGFAYFWGDFTSPMVLDDGKVSFPVAERDEAADLNGDGDAIDEVMHVYDPVTNTTANLRTTAQQAIRAEDGDLVLVVSEADEGRDLNGDSDTADRVVLVFDGRSGTVTNTRLSGFVPFTSTNGIGISVFEQHAGVDLNGDGDRTDWILQLVTNAEVSDEDRDGFSALGGDADDADPAVHPGATEVCDTKDNDQDGSIDEGFVCDTDHDGLDDDHDPDTVMTAVSQVPKSSFGSGGQPKAFQSNLDKAEALIKQGNVSGALTELRALRKRVDGCNGTASEKADSNDWITRCSDQRAVRTAIDSLIAALD